MSRVRRTLAVIGGSGLSDFLDGTPTLHRVATPWGPPSGPIAEGSLGDLKVLFLARHGPGHTIPPHRVNYRANVDALVSLGADAIVAVNSVGSLREELPPGTFVLPDQFVDWTKQRPTTFFDGGKVYHVSTADPFCPEISAKAELLGQSTDRPFATHKTYVCVEGPRFSTRSESKLFRTFADVIGMTLVPEVTLARERAVCYACLATVTDFDVWAERPVAATDILDVMKRNTDRMRKILSELLPKLAGPAECRCANALDDAAIG